MSSNHHHLCIQGKEAAMPVYIFPDHQGCLFPQKDFIHNTFAEASTIGSWRDSPASSDQAHWTTVCLEAVLRGVCLIQTALCRLRQEIAQSATARAEKERTPSWLMLIAQAALEVLKIDACAAFTQAFSIRHFCS